VALRPTNRSGVFLIFSVVVSAARSVPGVVA
jgi:hypothetical protein